MILASWISDRILNRGWPTQFGWWIMVVAFAIYLAVPSTNHQARFAALVLAETGHYSESSSVIAWEDRKLTRGQSAPL
jgi:hypothetical protein